MKQINCPKCGHLIEINPVKKPKLPSDYDTWYTREQIKDVESIPLWKKIMYWYKEKHEKVDWNDRTWDKGLWGRNSREAVILASACENDNNQWKYLVNEFTKTIINKGLNWTLETMSKHACSILAGYSEHVVLKEHEGIKNMNMPEDLMDFSRGHVRGIK